MNLNSSANRDVVELWGREFNIVKNGLSEAQVVSFVNDLVKQHDMLLQRQEHLAALTKLAEKTVSDADQMAEQIKQEARQAAQEEAARIKAEAEAAAKAEAERLFAEAEARVQQMIKEKETHAMAAAAEQAEAIKSAAERLASERKKETENEVKKILAEAESRGRHIIEQKEAEASAVAAEQASQILQKAHEEATSMLAREKQKIQPQIERMIEEIRSQLLRQIEDIRRQVGGIRIEFEQEAKSDAAAADASAPGEEKGGGLIDFMQDSAPSESEPEWEIEIVPPIDIMKIMSIVGYLDGLADVAKTEIIPRNDRTSVTVYSSSPVELVSMLRDLPEVASAEETNPAANGKPRRITLALSDKNTNKPNITEGSLLRDVAT